MTPGWSLDGIGAGAARWPGATAVAARTAWEGRVGMGEAIIGRRGVLRAGAGIGAAAALGVLGAPSASALPVYTAYYNGVSIEYVWSGAPLSRSIVFVHGGCHGSWCWGPYMQYLAACGWNCYSLNWFNHGGSLDQASSVFAARSIAAVTHEIRQTVLFCGSPAPLLVGHSMGALAAQRYAGQYSVRGLALICPVAPQEVGNAYVPIPVDPAVPWGPPPFADAQQMFFGGFTLASAQAYYARLEPESARAVLEATGRAGVSVSSLAVRARAPRITVIAAQNDTLTPPSVTAAVAAYYQCQYVQLSGQSHDGPLIGPNWTLGAQSLWAFAETT
ncbi:MAG TPA: alpha/beta hydrolase [Pseudonocardiaceae bacterium]